jgi:hypothetical protein
MIEERPPVEAPLTIYASVDRVVVRIEGALSLLSNHYIELLIIF